MKNLLCPLLLVCMALSSCHTPGLGVPAADSTAKQITLTFAVPDWELEQGSVSKVVAEFERQNPDIHIVLKSSSEILGLPPNSFSFEEDTWRRLAAAADVFRVPMSYGGLPRQAVRERAVRDLVSFIEADPTFQAADFQPGALAAASWDGGIWACLRRWITKSSSTTKPRSLRPAWPILNRTGPGLNWRRRPQHLLSATVHK